MKPRIVLWGTVAALAVGAAGLAVAVGGGSDGDGDDTASPPRLPLALAGAGDGGDEAASQAVDVAPVTYVAGDDVPDLGGTAPAYRVSEVSAAQVAALAEALGIEGEPTEADGSFTATGAGLTLTAYGPGGSWNVSTSAAGPDTPQSSPAEPATTVPAEPAGDAGGPASGSPGAGGTTTTVVCVRAPCEPAMSDPPGDVVAQTAPSLPATPATVPPCPADPGGTSCGDAGGGPGGSGGGGVPACEPGPAVTCPAAEPAVPPTTVGPEDLPPQDDAVALAERLYAAAGLPPGGGRAEATNPGDGWLVQVEPALGGVPAPGLAGQVSVGPDGVQHATGYFAPGDPLGDYPLLSTRQAIERMNRTGDVTIMSTPEEGGMPQPPTTGTVPGAVVEPAPTDSAPPAEIVLTGAEAVFVTVPSWDGSGSYVVPGYRFRDAEGSLVATVPAVADDALRSPPAGG